MHKILFLFLIIHILIHDYISDIFLHFFPLLRIFNSEGFRNLPKALGIKGSTWSYTYFSELSIQAVFYFAPLLIDSPIKNMLSKKSILSWPNNVENSQINNVGKNTLSHLLCSLCNFFFFFFLLCLTGLSETGL